MDNSAPAIPPTSNIEPVTPESPKTFLQKVLTWTQKHKVLVVIAFATIFIITAVIFLFQSPLVKNLKTKSATNQKSTKLPDNVVAQISGAPIFTTMVDLELAETRSTPSAEMRKKVTQKLINDELTLQFGREQGIVNHEANSENLTSEQYKQRLHDVALVKQSIVRDADHYSGEIIAINFFNNGQNSPDDLERNKEIARQKINTVYNQVKNNQLTMKEAGDVLKRDASLSAVDSALDQNSYITYTVNKGRNITFWLDFDAQLLKAENNELTPQYLGKQKDRNGVEQDAIYIFGRMNEKVVDRGYSTYLQWIDKQRSNHEINQ